MKKLDRGDLLSLEQYAVERAGFRKRLMAHKSDRRVELGEHAALFFEDRLTMQYQIQEILRAEKIFEPDGIQEELDAYNPLIPDGANLKATLMIQYEDVEERKSALAQLIGIETKIWLQVERHEKVYAIADEDLERETEEKTSSVHFLRYEFDQKMIADFKSGTSMLAGIEHAALPFDSFALAESAQHALRADFD